MDKTTLDDLAKKLADAVPGDITGLRADIENNFRGLLASGLDKLDLVTREEFDVQRKVLARTRDKLDRLEAELIALQQGTPAPGEPAGNDTPVAPDDQH